VAVRVAVRPRCCPSAGDGAGQLRSTEAAEDRKWVEQVQQLLAVPPAEDGQLPRLSTVSPSRYGSEGPAGTDTYVRRNADDELDHALRNKPVVLVADSRAGKSRTAAEAARRLTLKGICPGCGLALPIGRGAGVHCNRCWLWIKEDRVMRVGGFAAFGLAQDRSGVVQQLGLGEREQVDVIATGVRGTGAATRSRGSPRPGRSAEPRRSRTAARAGTRWSVHEDGFRPLTSQRAVVTTGHQQGARPLASMRGGVTTSIVLIGTRGDNHERAYAQRACDPDQRPRGERGRVPGPILHRAGSGDHEAGCRGGVMITTTALQAHADAWLRG
jgi:hypothetical protein